MKKIVYIFPPLFVLACVLCGLFILRSNRETADINEKNLFQFTQIEILDANDNVIHDDGGWYIVPKNIKLKICYNGAPDIVSVFYIPTGTQMSSKREQLVVYSLYEEGNEGIRFESSEEEGKEDSHSCTVRRYA